MKEVGGFKGYWISEHGLVWSDRSKKYLSQGKDTMGYRHVFLYDENIKRFCRRVHRLMAEAYIPNPQNKKIVNHINGLKLDNRLENLEWVTRSENTSHAYKLGLMRKKLSDQDVENIRKRLASGETQVKLAEEYSVSRDWINKIKLNKTRRV